DESEALSPANVQGWAMFPFPGGAPTPALLPFGRGPCPARGRRPGTLVVTLPTSGYFHYVGSGNTIQPMPAAPLLQIELLPASVEGTEILRGLDLPVGSGEAHALMRPNGPGKTTRANTLLRHPEHDATA